MKERQRWQPEEDALLRAYVKQYGARDWSLVAQRMGKPLLRDPKSCLERWKNYLKPGLKKGSLSPEEQALVVALQAKYGNKWKKIAAEVPGRTAKRLGKWWEVFKEKQLKQTEKVNGTNASPAEKPVQGPYDHILDTFAEKYVQSSGVVLPVPDPDPILSLGSANATSLPPWMSGAASSISSLSTTSSSATPSPSVSLTLSPCEPDPAEPSRLATLVVYCREAEESRASWVSHRKEAAWRLSRLEKQLESEMARKRREKAEEVEAEIRRLREDEVAYLGNIEAECREQLRTLRNDAEAKEAKLVETLAAKHAKLASLVDRIRLINSR